MRSKVCKSAYISKQTIQNFINFTWLKGIVNKSIFFVFSVALWLKNCCFENLSNLKRKKTKKMEYFFNINIVNRSNNSWVLMSAMSNKKDAFIPRPCLVLYSTSAIGLEIFYPTGNAVNKKEACIPRPCLVFIFDIGNRSNDVCVII